jgi:hypothetical protein
MAVFGVQQLLLLVEINLFYWQLHLEQIQEILLLMVVALRAVEIQEVQLVLRPHLVVVEEVVADTHQFLLEQVVHLDKVMLVVQEILIHQPTGLEEEEAGQEQLVFL